MCGFVCLLPALCALGGIHDASKKGKAGVDAIDVGWSLSLSTASRMHTDKILYDNKNRFVRKTVRLPVPAPIYTNRILDDAGVSPSKEENSSQKRISERGFFLSFSREALPIFLHVDGGL